MFADNAQHAPATPVVGHVSWSPDYKHFHAGSHPDAIEAGDSTFVRNRLTFDEIQPKYHPPAPANDNQLGAKPRVVGLMGYGGAGKSEVAKALAGAGFTRTHIKAPLRDMAASLLDSAGYSPSEIDAYLDGELKREVIPGLRRTGTEIQQFLGTEFGRDFCYPGLWLDLWRARAQVILGDGGKVVQESVRFANEAAAIRELGGVIVRVERPGVGPLSAHVSEVPPAEPDFIIRNNGTIRDLQLQVATWLMF